MDKADRSGLREGKYLVVRSTFTLAFYLKAFSKLGHKEVKPKERVSNSLSDCQKQRMEFEALGQWKFEGQNTRNEKAE